MKVQFIQALPRRCTHALHTHTAHMRCSTNVIRTRYTHTLQYKRYHTRCTHTLRPHTLRHAHCSTHVALHKLQNARRIKHTLKHARCSTHVARTRCKHTLQHTRRITHIAHPNPLFSCMCMCLRGLIWFTFRELVLQLLLCRSACCKKILTAHNMRKHVRTHPQPRAHTYIQTHTHAHTCTHDERTEEWKKERRKEGKKEGKLDARRNKFTSKAKHSSKHTCCSCRVTTMLSTSARRTLTACRERAIDSIRHVAARANAHIYTCLD